MGAGTQYRDDITGLRAVAVLAVIAYHFGGEWLPGGYLGVDIFFVVSGYVITRMIRKEVATTGRFRFGHFYLRRVRRLLPSLLATIALAFIGAALVFSPQYLEQFSVSAFAAVFSVSNALFWDQAGYFDESSLTKPLLHTWSLGVEEQFYLVWPLLVVLFVSTFGKRAVWAIVLCGLLSFAANFLITDTVVDFVSAHSSRLGRWLGKGTPTIFFLTPFRIFEFAIGAAIVFIPEDRVKGWASEALAIAGAAIIAYCLVTYRSAILFPSYNAILPCAGTALLILGGHSKVIGSVLRSRPAVRIGEMSYVLYLVHWPAFVIAREWLYYQWSLLVVALLTIFTFAVSYLIHVFIETPLRAPARPDETLSGRFGAATAVAIVIVLLPAGTAIYDHGWPWRVPSEVRDIAATENRVAQETIDTIRSVRPYDHRFLDDARPNVLILGDSMANDLALSLRLSGWDKLIDIEVLTISHMCGFIIADRSALPGYQFERSQIPRCEKRIASILSSPLITQADRIIVTHNWYDWVTAENLASALSALPARNGVPVYVMGRRRWFDRKISELILRRGSMRYADEDAFYFREPAPAVNDRVQQAANKVGAHYVSWNDLLCQADKCFAVHDARLLYRDRVHFSLAGAEFFGAMMKSDPTFREMLLGSPASASSDRAGL